MKTIDVSNSSHPFDIAGIITDLIREQKGAILQAIGAEAVNRAVKAVVMATSYLRAEDIFVTCVPEYAPVLFEGEERTAVKIVVDPYYPH
jgi:stage V sporulation protein S